VGMAGGLARQIFDDSLGYVANDLGANDISEHRRSLKLRAVKLKSLVQRLNRAIHLATVNQAGYPNLRRRDHVDIYLLLGKRREHPRGMPRVMLHSSADDRHFRQLGAADDVDGSHGV